MENCYGIGVFNRFALLLDEVSDPLELLKVKEQENVVKRKPKLAEKETKGKPENQTEPKPVPDQKKIIKESAVHKGQRLDKIAGENSFANRNRGGTNLGNKESGGPRGGFKGHNIDSRRGKREYDRQSGSDKKLTMDEWKTERDGRTKRTFKTRKSGEGDVNNIDSNNMYELKKKEVLEELQSKEVELKVTEYPQRVGRQKQFLEIKITFNDVRRLEPGSRGKGSRAQHKKKAPKVDDERDFPFLC